MDPRQATGFRQIAPEAVLLGGAGAAILLQLADPRVARGVAEHSAFATDPLRRLWGTLDYVYAVALGSSRLRAAQVAHVTRAHDEVHGEAAPGRPAYDAHDDDARTWVAMTLAWAGGRAWDVVLGPHPEEVDDTVVRGYSRLATALGVPEGRWFPTAASFRREFDSRLTGLSVSDDARHVARELLAATAAPAWVRALMPTVRLLTAGLLPPRLREDFDLPALRYGRGRDLAFRLGVGAAGGVYPRLPEAVRQAVATWRLSAQSREETSSSSP